MLFEGQVSGEIGLEVYGVKEVKMEESVTLQRGQEGFSRVLRMDISKFTERYKFLYCELRKMVRQVDEESYYFLVSKEKTPPSA